MNLLDSNILILGGRSDADAGLRDTFRQAYAYSVVSRIEVLGFSRLTAQEQLKLKDLLNGGAELPFTTSIATNAVELRQQRRMGLGDAVIAATALVHSLPLLTRNVADFRHIAGLQLNPA